MKPQTHHLDWICSMGWTVDYTSKRCLRKYIEFRHKAHRTFWRLTILEAFEYLGGVNP